MKAVPEVLVCKTKTNTVTIAETDFRNYPSIELAFRVCQSEDELMNKPKEI